MSDDATTAQREHWFATYQRRAAGRARHLTDQGFIAARGKALETLQAWGWRGRERWTDWALMEPTPEPQVWFPLWVVQIVMWCLPFIDNPSVALSDPDGADVVVRRLLHALAHDPEARAAALSTARLGREPVPEFLRGYDERVRRCRYVAGF